MVTTMAITAIMETMIIITMIMETMTMTTITIKETMNMIMETMTMTMETMIMITRIMETIQSRFNRAGSCRFDEKKCEAGIEALGFYHEKKGEQRDVGLGPSHDWSSHCADAFGLMAISYEDPVRTAGFNRKIEYRRPDII
jgi:hypothetical protein